MTYGTKKFFAIAAVLIAALGAELYGQAAERPVFDVVSVKPDNSEQKDIHIFSPTDGDGMMMTNVTMEDLIDYAYNIRSRDLLKGLPDWAKSERYDVQAKVADADVALFRKLNEPARQEMIRELLGKTFEMKSHTEPKETAIYALVVAKGGSKMKEVKAGDSRPVGADGKPVEMGLSGRGAGNMAAYEIPMKIFGPSLSGLAGRQVVDKTDLPGNYDFTLTWVPEEKASAGVSGPSIFAALEEQLGLKLETRKISMPVLMVDSIQRAKN